MFGDRTHLVLREPPEGVAHHLEVRVEVTGPRLPRESCDESRIADTRGRTRCAPASASPVAPQSSSRPIVRRSGHGGIGDERAGDARLHVSLARRTRGRRPRSRSWPQRARGRTRRSGSPTAAGRHHRSRRGEAPRVDDALGDRDDLGRGRKIRLLAHGGEAISAEHGGSAGSRTSSQAPRDRAGSGRR